ncbi:MAG: hypothetical protein JTT11_01200 [Candidatus Brockarchaeota archaeon]|nr:hypothetical protein [Candidatus Brockarchaeota archaeon]
MSGGMAKANIDRIVDIAKRRGLVYQSSEIYGGISGFFDYGPAGFLLKEKIVRYWREFFLHSEDNIFEVETCTIMPEQVFKASGHLKDFIDPATQCRKCNSIFRADNLVEECTGQFVEGADAAELSRMISEMQVRCPKCGGELGEVRVST